MQNKNSKEFKKNKTLSAIIVFLWIVLLGILGYFLYMNIINNLTNIFLPLLIIPLLILFTVFFYSLCGGVRELVYVHYFFLFRKRLYKRVAQVENVKLKLSNAPKVILLYCTYNDFNPKSLLKSMQQKYKNFKTFILDDSTNEEYKKQIDIFCKKYNVDVIRRKNRTGFKAGNLNNFLKKYKDYNYFVVLDSDEIIPNNFISESLKYFFYYNNIGIVQANHIATRNNNSFMNSFAPSVNSHWETFQNIKSECGFSFFLGHGGMISKKAFNIANGFPEVVAEDLAFSIEVRKGNLLTIFAPNIICEEEFPINYVAFKIRQAKWTSGTIEFFKKYYKKIFRNEFKLSFFEKQDLLLSSFSTLGSVISVGVILIYHFALPLSGFVIYFPWWFLIITSLIFLTPVLNDVYHYLFKMNFFKFLVYLLHSFFLPGSLFLLSFFSVILTFFGKKANFLVTPKNNDIHSWKFAILYNWKEIIFSLILILMIILWPHLIFIFLTLIMANISSIYLTILSNFNINSQPIISLKNIKKN